MPNLMKKKKEEKKRRRGKLRRWGEEGGKGGVFLGLAMVPAAKKEGKVFSPISDKGKKENIGGVATISSVKEKRKKKAKCLVPTEEREKKAGLVPIWYEKKHGLRAFGRKKR